MHAPWSLVLMTSGVCLYDDVQYGDDSPPVLGHGHRTTAPLDAPIAERVRRVLRLTYIAYSPHYAQPTPARDLTQVPHY